MKQNTSSYWQKENTETLFKHPRIVLVEDDVTLPDGSKTKYMRFEGLRDYVTVIAERDGRIALVKDYSYPLDEWLLQLPEGVCDIDETPTETAGRELAEEAGLMSDDFEIIGMNYGHHRRSDYKNYVVLARNAHEGQKLDGDQEELGIEMCWLAIKEIKRMIKDGEIRQKNTLAALMVYFAASDR